MTPSNRTWVCVVCGEVRRAPLPAGLRKWVPVDVQLAEEQPALKWPAPHGHWGNWVVDSSFVLPAWLHHCGQPLFLLGKRASQAASQIDAADRLRWIALNCRVSEHAGGKRWRPILREDRLKDAYPLV